MECRKGCAACCIFPSISSALPGLPDGKPAGVSCPHLDDRLYCRLWGTPAFPEVCRRFPPRLDTCGETNEEARELLRRMEEATNPLSAVPIPSSSTVGLFG